MPKTKHTQPKLILLKIFALIFVASCIVPPPIAVASDCKDLNLIFARGSGGIPEVDPSLLAFKSALEAKLATTNLSYQFIDLNYPAIPIGLDHLKNSLGAYFSGGNAHAFGDSVNSGVSELIRLVNFSPCPQTKFVLGGYSQGAMVITKSLPHLNPDRILYAATFGDPKLFLPEGAGPFHPACSGLHLSNYRVFVPNCQTYQGILGGQKPYQPSAFIDKLGTWCNNADIICGSGLSVRGHQSYITDQRFEDASRFIFHKIVKTFHIDSIVTSPHDTAILFDSTQSMLPFLKARSLEVLEIAKKTFAIDGRVALFAYGDLVQSEQPLAELCNFNTCTLEVIKTALENLKPNGGGDSPESLLYASYQTMLTLNWRRGATKSIIVFTDAGFHSPDLNGITLNQVVELSRSIDPVNFYVITTDGIMPYYKKITTDTGGLVVSNSSNLSQLFDQIIQRFDSLPRVEFNVAPPDPPTISVVSADRPQPTELHLLTKTNALKTLVVLDDQILGFTTEQDFTITELDPDLPHRVSLVPLGETNRGHAITVKLDPSLVDGVPTNSAPILEPESIFHAEPAKPEGSAEPTKPAAPAVSEPPSAPKSTDFAPTPVLPTFPNVNYPKAPDSGIPKP